MKKRVICGGVCALLFLGLGLFALLGLESVINDVILDGVVLDPNTYDVWGAVPGSTDTVTLRRFTMFNFTNPRGFLYRGEKPRFHEMSNYDYQELNNFTNCQYSSDKSKIDFNFWLYFKVMPKSRPPQEKIVALNLAPLGFWSQLDSLDISALAIQGFGGLFIEMNATIVVQAIGQGVAGQFLANQTAWNPICRGLGFTSAFCQMLWSDPIYGLSDQNNYEIWVEWAYYKDKDCQMVLYEYFGFEKVQMDSLGRLLAGWSAAVDDILNNWYCNGEGCQNYDLTLRQLGSGSITNNPPSGEAVDSICMSGNVTCEGSPELFAFYKYVWPTINNDSAYKNLKFSTETTKALFTPYNGTLLNVGNLSELFRLGYAYDKSKKDASLLKEIQRVTHAESDKHALVIWQYTKYFTNEFVLKMSEKGSRKVAGLSGVFAAAIYQSFIQFSEWALSELLSLQVAEAAGDCKTFLTRTVDSIDPVKITELCKQIDQKHYQNYFRLIQPCQNEYFRDDFQMKYDLSGYQMSELCGPEDESIGQLLKQAHQVLHKTYGCTANKNTDRCTEFQLGLKQFINSTVTLNPIPSKIHQYPSAYSGHDWNPILQEWEYRQYLSAGLGNADIDPQIFADYLQLADLLSFDKLFSVPKVQDLLILQDATNFTKTFYWKNRNLLVGYVKWVAVQVGFGGFVQSRSVQELMFGYQDDFLKQLKEMDPMLGGDPSIVTLVALNELNSTLAESVNKPQSMYTGYSDPLLTRVYVSNLNHTYITYNRSFYDGYEVHTELANPYTEEVTLYGTDAVQNHPMSDPSINQYIYVDTLYRVGELTYESDRERYGFELLRYVLSENTLASGKDYPPNAKFYQGIKGFMNLSFLGLPLFAGKNHFLGADPIWAEKVQIFDESGVHPQTANPYDESELVIEPKTGASFTATLYLQTSMLLQKDLLFTREETLLPIFTIYRSGNLTEQACDDLLGDLRIALGLPRQLAIASAVGIFLMALCICCCLKSKKERKVPESLLESSNDISQTAGEAQEGNIQAEKSEA